YDDPLFSFSLLWNSWGIWPILLKFQNKILLSLTWLIGRLNQSIIANHQTLATTFPLEAYSSCGVAQVVHLDRVDVDGFIKNLKIQEGGQ
ncbi:hypothetical protein ACJX0J_007234, partial [Zea mays]